MATLMNALSMCDTLKPSRSSGYAAEPSIGGWTNASGWCAIVPIALRTMR
jgi:hypothetical protein